MRISLCLIGVDQGLGNMNRGICLMLVLDHGINKGLFFGVVCLIGKLVTATCTARKLRWRVTMQWSPSPNPSLRIKTIRAVSVSKSSAFPRDLSTKVAIPEMKT